jgi:hypothetical protein
MLGYSKTERIIAVKHVIYSKPKRFSTESIQRLTVGLLYFRLEE